MFSKTLDLKLVSYFTLVPRKGSVTRLVASCLDHPVDEYPDSKSSARSWLERALLLFESFSEIDVVIDLLDVLEVLERVDHLLELDEVVR